MIVATDELARAYRKLNPNVYVCPNSIEPADWPVIERPDDGIFRVGWYASFSHADDAGLIRRAMEWASGQAGVEVVTMGFHPAWQFRAPPDSLVERPGRLLETDGDSSTWACAPSIPNPWSICRSDLKAMEYAMGGVCPLGLGRAPLQGLGGRRRLSESRQCEGVLPQVEVAGG